MYVVVPSPSPASVTLAAYHLTIQGGNPSTHCTCQPCATLPQAFDKVNSKRKPLPPTPAANATANGTDKAGPEAESSAEGGRQGETQDQAGEADDDVPQHDEL